MVRGHGQQRRPAGLQALRRARRGTVPILMVCSPRHRRAPRRGGQRHRLQGRRRRASSAGQARAQLRAPRRRRAAQRGTRWTRLGLRRAPASPCPSLARAPRAAPGHREQLPGARAGRLRRAAPAAALRGAHRAGGPAGRRPVARAPRAGGHTARAYVEPCTVADRPVRGGAGVRRGVPRRLGERSAGRRPSCIARCEQTRTFVSSASRPSTTARRPPVATRPSTRRACPRGPKASP